MKFFYFTRFENRKYGTTLLSIFDIYQKLYTKV